EGVAAVPVPVVPVPPELGGFQGRPARMALSISGGHHMVCAWLVAARTVTRGSARISLEAIDIGSSVLVRDGERAGSGSGTSRGRTGEREILSQNPCVRASRVPRPVYARKKARARRGRGCEDRAPE